MHDGKEIWHVVKPSNTVIPWRLVVGFFFCTKVELLLLCDCIAFDWNFGYALVMVTNH